MREIKFRVYDKDLKKMRYLNEPHDSIGFREDGNAYYHNLQTGLGEWFSDLMQFTGLRDKKGVEIYEGDIVKNKLSFMSLENVDVVEFNEVDCSFMLGKGKRHFNKNLVLEVIGNIYENKELLEK